MKPQKFLKSYKCDCFQPDNFCNCSHKKISEDVLLENIVDTAEALIEVMDLCGIRETKPTAISDIITFHFLHFDEILYRIDSVPKKRLNKEHLMNDLGRKSGMNRRESQMAFSIIKKAFKAFYHGTGQGGTPWRFQDQLKHSTECFWVHAAQRTAQICATYEGMFLATQKDLECKIKLVYKQLYDRFTERAPAEKDHECACIKCNKRIAKETLRPKPSTWDFHIKTDSFEDLFLKEQEKLLMTRETVEQKSEATLKNKIACPCPSLSMTENDYKYRQFAENIKVVPTSAPFSCHWISISKEEFETDENAINIKLPEEFLCSPPKLDEEFDSECECLFEDCSCKSESDNEYDDKDEVKSENEQAQHQEEVSV